MNYNEGNNEKENIWDDQDKNEWTMKNSKRIDAIFIVNAIMVTAGNKENSKPNFNKYNVYVLRYWQNNECNLATLALGSPPLVRCTKKSMIAGKVSASCQGRRKYAELNK